jgi:hypothetical protein
VTTHSDQYPFYTKLFGPYSVPRGGGKDKIFCLWREVNTTSASYSPPLYWLLRTDLLNIFKDEVSCVAIKAEDRVCTYIHMNTVLFSLLQTWGQDGNTIKFISSFVNAMCQPMIFCWYGTAIIHNVSQSKLETSVIICASICSYPTCTFLTINVLVKLATKTNLCHSSVCCIPANMSLWAQD